MLGAHTAAGIDDCDIKSCKTCFEDTNGFASAATAFEKSGAAEASLQSNCCTSSRRSGLGAEAMSSRTPSRVPQSMRSLTAPLTTCAGLNCAFPRPLLSMPLMVTASWKSAMACKELSQLHVNEKLFLVSSSSLLASSKMTLARPSVPFSALLLRLPQLLAAQLTTDNFPCAHSSASLLHDFLGGLKKCFPVTPKEGSVLHHQKLVHHNQKLCTTLSSYLAFEKERNPRGVCRAR